MNAGAARLAAGNDEDLGVARVASVIGEPARARILYSLLDGLARTGTELGAIADVGASTASAHLSRLLAERLVKVHLQGKHRYYQLNGPEVARVLEGLSVLAGTRPKFVSNTPNRLRAARSCYDHLAGAVGVAIHDRLFALGYLQESAGYDLTTQGEAALSALGIDVARARASRRRFAYGCLDWSERRCHLGGSLGAELLGFLVARKWVMRDLDSRALQVTPLGVKRFASYFGVRF